MNISLIVVFVGGTYPALLLGSWTSGIDAHASHSIDLIASPRWVRVPRPT